MASKILFFLFSILLSMVGTKALAYDIKVENADGVTIYYNYINDGKELEVTCYGYSGSVVIPEEVTYMNRSRKVTSIGENAFDGCSELTSVTIPNSVTSIGKSAFYYCMKLTSISIPNSVTSIGVSAFQHCINLTSVTIPNSVTSIGDVAFAGCTSLTSVTIGTSVTSIGEGAFNGCSGLTSVTIPNSVTSIGDYAFFFCTGLTSVTISNSITSIGAQTFCYCTSLTTVTIPNNVTSIGDYAFSSCSGLSSVTIGTSVTSIGEGSFIVCSGLTSVTIPNGVTSIGDYAFENCTGLTSVTIPNSITSIGESAFSGCDIPEVISKIENPFNIDANTFSNNTYLNATLSVPAGTIGKYKATEGWKKFVFIEEGNGNNPSDKDKCEKPTISYTNGKLTFNSATEGAICQSTITDSDIKTYSSNEVQLGVTYEISVYATKAGYENSETVTATLCWIDVEPRTEGVTNDVANVRAVAIMIQNEGGLLTINGADDNASIAVYDLNGIQVGSAISNNGVAYVNTNLCRDSIAIVKIGNKSVKVIIK